MQRVNIVGVSGSGKSTLAANLARVLDLPHLEVDGVFHQPGWQPLPADQFCAAVKGFMADNASGWVIDGNYRKVRPMLWTQGTGVDTVIWIDLPKWQTMLQLLIRTLRRVITRQQLWNGNMESWGNILSTDPETSVLAFAWKNWDTTRGSILDAMRDPAYGHIRFVRLTSRREVDEFVAAAASAECENRKQPVSPALDSLGVELQAHS